MFKSVSDWLSEYERLLSKKNFSSRTLNEKHRHLIIINSKIGLLKLNEIKTIHLKNVIDEYVIADKPCMAKAMHSLLRDIFNDAMIHGLIDSNPIWPLKYPTQRVKRARLLFDEFMLMYNYAKITSPAYLSGAMMLALVTAQRPGDLLEMGFNEENCFVKDDYLFIHQLKGRKYIKIENENRLVKRGSKLALPLNLTLDVVKTSIQDAIILCDGKNHFIESNGEKVQYWRLNKDFCNLRDSVFKKEHWDGCNPPSFFEIRSLAERLYREQKINTQVLLGHKYRSTTDLYNDLRGREWRYLRI